MATRFCDHGLYAAPVAGGTVPTAAEDGNGAAKTAATMATLVITFTGIPTADGAITIAGVTFTAKASGATGNQFNAVTDAATCATNLKNAINASATNAIKPAGAIAATAPLRNVVNATVSGAVVTIYTRCAGSEWNSVVETSTLTNASITAQWSGGADGAWGYIRNVSAAIAWPTSKAINTYGIWSAAPCYLGTLVVGDNCIIRAGKTLDYGAFNTASYLESAYIGNETGYITYTIDDGTEWPADGPEPILKFTKKQLGNYAWDVFKGVYFINVVGTNYPSGVNNLQFEVSGAVGLGSNGNLRLYFGNGCIFSNLDLTATENATPQFAQYQSGLVARSVFNNVRITCKGRANYLVNVLGNYPINAEFNQCSFTLTAASVPLTLMSLFSGYSKSQKYVFNSCTCSGFVTGSQLLSSSGTGYDQYIAFFRDCDFPNITIQGPLLLSGGGSLIAGTRGVYMTSRTGTRDFMLENPGVSFIEWRAQKARPTLNARLLDGITAWSIFAIPSTSVGVVTRVTPIELPTISKWVPAAVDLAEGVRTIKVNFLLESTISWTALDVSVFLTYTDTTGLPALTDSFNPLAGALVSSSASWSTTSWNSQTWVPFEMTVTTSRAVKEGTEICATLRIHNTVANISQGIIFDPELIVS